MRTSFNCAVSLESIQARWHSAQNIKRTRHPVEWKLQGAHLFPVQSGAFESTERTYIAIAIAAYTLSVHTLCALSVLERGVPPVRGTPRV